MHTRLAPRQASHTDWLVLIRYRANSHALVQAHELASKADSLAKDKPIVAYCRGPFCLYARDAVSWLTAQGFHVSQWQDGVAEFAQTD